MEERDWLGNILFWILDLLNQQWLAIVVAIVGSFAVAYFTKLSPKDDWRFLEKGPAKVLFGAFLMFAALKATPRLVLPETTFACDREPGALGLELSTNCRFEPQGRLQYVADYTLGDVVKAFYTSLFYDLVFGAVGAVAGVLVALMVLRGRETPRA